MHVFIPSHPEVELLPALSFKKEPMQQSGRWSAGHKSSGWGPLWILPCQSKPVFFNPFFFLSLLFPFLTLSSFPFPFYLEAGDPMLQGALHRKPDIDHRSLLAALPGSSTEEFWLFSTSHWTLPTLPPSGVLRGPVNTTQHSTTQTSVRAHSTPELQTSLMRGEISLVSLNQQCIVCIK
jgi:hypothetical protein